MAKTTHQEIDYEFKFLEDGNKVLSRRRTRPHYQHSICSRTHTVSQKNVTLFIFVIT